MNKNKFNFFGNNMAVDFGNTSFSDRGRNIDLLLNANDFCQRFEVVGVDVRLNEANVQFSKIIQLRKLLREGFERCVVGEFVAQSLVEVINSYLPYYEVTHQIAMEDGKVKLSAQNSPRTLEAALAIIAYEAAALLCSEKVKQLKGCANDNCVAMFVDTSKAKKRRWCSMNLCGNRVKAANHYALSKNETP